MILYRSKLTSEREGAQGVRNAQHNVAVTQVPVNNQQEFPTLQNRFDSLLEEDEIVMISLSADFFQRICNG